MEINKNKKIKDHFVYYLAYLSVILHFIFYNAVYASTVTVSNSNEFQLALENKEVSKILLKSGVYKGNFEMKRSDISILPDEGETPILNAENLEKPVLSILGAYLGFIKKNNIIVKDLSIISESNEGVGILIERVDNVTISNVDIKGGVIGLIARSSKSVNIDKCLFDGSHIAIFVNNLGGNQDITNIENCIFKDNIVALSQDGLEFAVLKVINCNFNVKKALDGAPIAIDLGDNWEGWRNELHLSNNKYDDSYIRLFFKEDNSTKTIGEQVLSFEYELIKRFVIPENSSELFKNYLNDEGKNELSETVSSPDNLLYEALLSEDYFVWSVWAKRYLNQACKTNSSIIENMGNIILAIELCIFPPTFESLYTNFRGVSKSDRADLLIELVKDNNFMKDYFLPAVWFCSSGKPNVFKIISDQIEIEGTRTINLVDEIPSIRIDAFRYNMSIYSQYRENISFAKKVLDHVSQIVQNDSSASIEVVKQIKNLESNMASIIPIGDKIFRAMYFDAPLWVIMADFYAAIKRAEADEDKISNLSFQCASFGVIASRVIVTDVTKNGWNVLLDEFRKSLPKKKFKEMVKNANTIPPWWKDTGGIMLEETDFK